MALFGGAVALFGQNLPAGFRARVLAIQSFLKMLKHRAFHYFAPYCWLVGVGFTLYLALT